MSMMGAALARALSYAALTNELQKLTPKQRFVIERSWGLWGCGPFSFREIADALDVDVASVYRIYARGMDKLSKEVEDNS